MQLNYDIDMIDKIAEKNNGDLLKTAAEIINSM